MSPGLWLYAPTEVEALRRLMRERPAAAAFGRRSQDRRRPTPATIGYAAVAALGLMAMVGFATLCPPSLRPHLGDPQLERFGAYFVTAAMFVIAYPRRAVTIALAAVVVAAGLEWAQFLVPGRDAGVLDANAKALGGVAGAAAAGAGLSLWRRARTLQGRLALARAH